MLGDGGPQGSAGRDGNPDSFMRHLSHWHAGDQVGCRAEIVPGEGQLPLIEGLLCAGGGACETSLDPPAGGVIKTPTYSWGH